LLGIVIERITRRDAILATIVSVLVPFSYNLTKVSLPVKMASVGLGKGVIILPMLIGNCFQVVIRPISGIYAEKYGHKKFFCTAPLLYSLSFILISMSRNVVDIIFSTIILSMGIAMFWSAFLAFSSYIHPERIALSIGHILAFSYIGALMGTALSGYLYEHYGMFFVFLAASIICILATFVSIFITSAQGKKYFEQSSAIAIIRRNMKDILTNSNIIAMIPIVNMYAPILLLESGVSPTYVGLLLTSLPLMSAIMQYVGGFLYSHVVNHRHVINMMSLIFLSLFAYASAEKLIIIGSLCFIIYSLLSSFLFAPQLSTAVDKSENMRAVGASGFGAGIAMGRVIAASLSVIGGYVADTHIINVSSPMFAMVLSSTTFGIITVASRILGGAYEE